MRYLFAGGQVPMTREWDADSFAFEDFRFTLDRMTLEELSSQMEGGGTGRQRRTENANGAAIWLDITEKLRSRLVDDGPGYCILSGFDSVSPELWRPLFRTLSLQLGDFYPQNSEGLEIKEVRDRGTAIGEGKSSRYSDSRYGGSLHTDGAESPMPVPDYFCLFCVSRAASGGAFQMVRASTAYRLLMQREPDAVSVLAESFHFDRRGDLGPKGEKTVCKPIFFLEGGEVCVTYLREYVNAGHAYDDIPNLTTKREQALDALDDVLAEPSLRVEGYLNPGEAVIVNNKSILHGRTTFEDNPESKRKRLLLRSWIRKRCR